MPSFLELYGNFDPELHNQQNAEESADTQILAPSFPGQNQILAPNFAAQTAPPPSQQQQQQPVKQKPHFHYPSKMHEQYNKDMEAIRQYLDRGKNLILIYKSENRTVWGGLPLVHQQKYIWCMYSVAIQKYG